MHYKRYSKSERAYTLITEKKVEFFMYEKVLGRFH